MILKRLLPFLLCLLALFPVWAEAASVQPAQPQGHAVHESHSAVSHPCRGMHDSAATGCETSPAGNPSPCDTGNCLMHCLVPQVKADIATAVPPGTPTFFPHAVAFSSVTLETPSRPPSSL